MTEEITAGGVTVPVSNAAKVLFPEPGQFTISAVRARLEGADDPWAGFTRARHGLGPAVKRLAGLSRD